jgi:hypothetical protein
MIGDCLLPLIIRRLVIHYAPERLLKYLPVDERGAYKKQPTKAKPQIRLKSD